MAAAPLSPRNAATRARFGSISGRSSWREGRQAASGEWLVGSEDIDEAEAAAGGAAAAAAAGGGVVAGWGGEGEGVGVGGVGVATLSGELSGGSMGCVDADAADTVLVDPLATR